MTGRPDLPSVVLYERPECGLCEEAAQLLKALSRELAYVLTRVDIEQDDLLVGRYGLEIPVVELEDGRELARAPIDGAALRQALEQALRERRAEAADLP